MARMPDGVKAFFDHPRAQEIIAALWVDYRTHSTGRIEVREDAPAWLEQVVIPCAACGTPIHPVRPHLGKRRAFAVSCELKVTLDCARNRGPVKQLCEDIRQAIGGAPIPEGMLPFGDDHE